MFFKIMNFLSLGNMFIIQNKYLRDNLVLKALCHGSIHRYICKCELHSMEGACLLTKEYGKLPF